MKKKTEKKSQWRWNVLSKFGSLSEENQRPSKEGVYKVAVAANIVQLHVLLTAQCRSDPASNKFKFLCICPAATNP